MPYQLLGFLAMCFVGMTTLNRILEGAFIMADEVGVLNKLAITNNQSIFGLFNLPVLNADFFLVGIPSLVKWDYGFFGGNAALFQYFLYSFTFALSFLLFIVIIGVVGQYFARR